MVYIIRGMVEVFTTDEFVAWYRSLAEGLQGDVEHAVELLALKGVTLDYPVEQRHQGRQLCAP